MTLFSYLYLHKNAYNSGPYDSLDECETVLECLCLVLTVPQIKILGHKTFQGLLPLFEECF